MSTIEGLKYIPNFIDEETERSCVEQIMATPWDEYLKRRVQHYGWTYRYTERTVRREDYLGPLPAWTEPLLQKLGEVSQTPFDQLIVNEYTPGQGIAPHVDQPQIFDSEIVSISLLSGIQMNFQNRKTSETHQQYLEPRSAVCLSGPARYEWTHGIVGRLSDPPKPGMSSRIPRKTRISLTFRRVLQNKIT